MKHPELPFASFLAALLVLIPLPWHWRARNVATLSIIAWLFLVDIIYGVNSLVWDGNVKITMTVWCDITSKIAVGASYALPLATLCVCKHLEMVASSRKVSFDYVDRRRRVIFEAVVCFGFPLVFMALHYIVQGHRFDIFENTGCQAAVYISAQAILIIWLPQLLFSAVTMIYAAIALHHFVRRRLMFASHLQNSSSALTTNRYLRLIAMALTEMVWGTTLTSYNLYNNVSGGLRPWTTWADVHSNFSRIDQFPEMIIPPEFRRVMMLFWWAMPVSSLIFFLFFGFGEEAKKEYLKGWHWAKTAILHRHPTEEKGIKMSTISFENFGPKSMKLVPNKNISINQTPISNPIFTPSSNPPLHTLVAPSLTKSTNRVTQLSTVGEQPALDSSDTLSDSSFAIYAQSYDLSHSYRSSIHSVVHIDDQPPQLPNIPLSPSFSASLRPSPTLSTPESLSPRFPWSQPPPGCLPNPIYHRPFCPPNVYPTTRPHPISQHRTLVTGHRQASVDERVLVPPDTRDFV